MKRVKGTDGVKLIECVNPMLNKWHVRWDVQPANGTNANGEPETGVSYMEAEFLHEPSQDEIKDLITGWFNKCIDEKILSGFVWNGMPVWLSTENQFNYKTAYDLAAQTGGGTLPVKFKFGTVTEPVYHTFNTLDELTDFYTHAVGFVQTTLAEGWEAKDAFDYKPYQKEN